jgi:hypothetical protein
LEASLFNGFREIEMVFPEMIFDQRIKTADEERTKFCKTQTRIKLPDANGTYR